MSDRAKSHMGGSKPKSSKSKSKKPHHVTVHHAANGGFIVKHHPDPSSPDAPEDHIVPDMSQLQQHLGDAMAQPPAAAPAATPAPAAAPPPGM